MGTAKSIKVPSKCTRRDLPPNYFSIFKKKAIMVAGKETRKWSKHIAKEAKDIIRGQKYNWPPLSEAYQDYKEREGLDPGILMATRDYVNKGIGWWEKNKRIFVGPRRGIHEPSGLPYQLLGRWLEFGTKLMPARQVWRPLLSVMIGKHREFKKLYRAAVARASSESMKRKKTSTTRGRG